MYNSYMTMSRRISALKDFFNSFVSDGQIIGGIILKINCKGFTVHIYKIRTYKQGLESV